MAGPSIERTDRMGLGALAAVLSGLLGYLLLGAGWAVANGESLGFFHQEVFLRSPLFKDRILSVCTLCMVPSFHLAYRREMDRFARGSMLVMVLTVLVIAWLQWGGE